MPADNAAALLVNGRYMTRPPTGVDRFAIELMRAAYAEAPGGLPLAALPPGAELQGAASPLPTQHLGQRSGHGWEQIDLPRAARGRALINLCNTAPAWLAQQMVVIHDAATVANPGNYSLAFRSWYRLLHGTLMRRARVVATVSRFSAGELTRHYGKRRRGIEIIGEGGEHILRQPADLGIIHRLGLQGRTFVLAVGGASVNKNFAAVLKAVEQLPQHDVLLVATGKQDARVFGNETLGSSPRLRPAGYVSDAELRALYEHAACFAFPSFYEGFGLPPLEAMSCGCPVVVSDRASLPEVCGDAALYCQPDDPATLLAALQRVLASPPLREEMSHAGRSRAARFSWAQAATQYLQIVDAAFR